jgi:epoxide hydrolase-like predicted phosphatase
MRKPDPRIYTHVLGELQLGAEEAVFLDDIARNLKPAREMGMHTIKVDDPDDALAELERVLGFPLR